MYLKRFSVKNIRSIREASMEFASGTEAGWHVILGANGSGKSSLVRAFALLMMGEKEAYAARQDFSQWMHKGEKHSSIEGQVLMDADYDTVTGGGVAPKRPISLQVSFEKGELASPDLKFSGSHVLRTVWGGGNGWFSASFGPFRRFTGGDKQYDRLFISNKRLASHLTALGEDVALTDTMEWLTKMHMQSTQNGEDNAKSIETSNDIFFKVFMFLTDSNFLPHSARITAIASGNNVTNSGRIYVTDGNGIRVSLDQLSDGYRSALSMVIELIRQMCELYGYEKMASAIDDEAGIISAPGVVFIDEVDVHLHPTWQRDIGRWLTRCFPNVQFIVTTHSPIVCRAVAGDDGVLRGSVWRLPAPGEAGSLQRIDGDDLNQLVYGDVMDAYATELFGSDVLRSSAGAAKLERLAELNTRALSSKLEADEEAERKALRRIFPANAGSLRS